MWRLGICAVLALFILVAPCPATADSDAAPKINWLTYGEAQRQKDGERKFFIYFHADWCAYCHKLKKNAFADRSIIEYLNENYIPVIVDTDKEKRLADRFGVQGLPDLRFLTPGGEDIARWPGYIEKDHLLNMLQFIHTDSFNKMSFRDFVKQKKKSS